MACMAHWCPRCHTSIFDNEPNGYCQVCKCWMVNSWDEEGRDEVEEGEYEDTDEGVYDDD